MIVPCLLQVYLFIIIIIIIINSIKAFLTFTYKIEIKKEKDTDTHAHTNLYSTNRRIQSYTKLLQQYRYLVCKLHYNDIALN